MADPVDLVVRKNTYLTNAHAKALAAEGVVAAVRRLGKDKVAEACDKQVRTVEKWMSQASLPGLDDMLNLTDAAPEAFRPLLAEKDWVLTPETTQPAEHMQLAAGLGHSLAELIERLRDGRICHVDRAVLASLFRELIPAMQAIVNEDDALRKAG